MTSRERVLMALNHEEPDRAPLDLGSSLVNSIHAQTLHHVREQVAERMSIFKPGGGFVFNPDHNIQPNTPPENVIAAYETAIEFGAY